MEVAKKDEMGTEKERWQTHGEGGSRGGVLNNLETADDITKRVSTDLTELYNRYLDKKNKKDEKRGMSLRNEINK